METSIELIDTIIACKRIDSAIRTTCTTRSLAVPYQTLLD